MKSKAPLVLMEQIIMVLVFAMAAALCLQAFVLSEKISKQTEARGRAAIEAQNVAESMKVRGFSEFVKGAEQTAEGFQLFYDATWKMVSAEAAEYVITISPVHADNAYIWNAEIVVKEQEGAELFRIPVAGQTEVTQDE